MIRPCKECGCKLIRVFRIDMIDNVAADTTVVRCINCGTEVVGKDEEQTIDKWNNRRSKLEQAMYEAMMQLDENKRMFLPDVLITEEQLEKLLNATFYLPKEFEVKTMDVQHPKMRMIGDRMMPLYEGKLAVIKYINQSAEAEENKTGG